MADDLAMQTRCIKCRLEQYILAVLPVSYGEAGCVWCGQLSAPMTRDQWRQIITDQQESPINDEPRTGDEPRFSCTTCRQRYHTLDELLAHLRKEHQTSLPVDE